ncbi:MAG: hypothetical protein NC087_04530 [Anaeroplasma bactoclasticum]|nr:hypothetical protein [Anaeroplasma bactoclasticum]
MSKLSKIKQTKEAKLDYYHPIIAILANKCSKQDIMGVLHCNDRDVRELISECAMHYPVITYSAKGVGYRRARAIDSLTEQELTLEYEEVLKETFKATYRMDKSCTNQK